MELLPTTGAAPVLGGQIVADMDGSGTWTRGYVYAGSELLAGQQQASVYWMHEDPIAKSKRVTNIVGTVVSTIELDPWGADTTRSSNAAFQPKKFTSYERDGNLSDESMFRRYNRWHSRSDQPDPYDGSISLTDPQSLNRYAYVRNDPVNFVDPTGLRWILPQTCSTARGLDGGGITCAFGDYYWVDDPAPVSRDSLEGKPTGGGGGGPQDSTQPPFDWALFWDLVKAAAALQRERCRSLFGGDADVMGILGVLASGDTNFGSITRGDLGAPKGGLVSAAVTTGITGRKLFLPSSVGAKLIAQTAWVGANITINNNAQAPGQAGYRDYLGVGASDAVYRAITLIHELGHVASIIYGTDASRILWDENNPAQSRANSQLVYDNCFRPE